MKQSSSIIGHQEIISYLQHILDTNALPGCIGLMGPEHVGKRAIVDLFLHNLKTRFPATIVQTVSAWNEEDAKYASITIDDIRSAISNSLYTQQADAWQVILIDGADYLTEQASNALLKAMEEPSERVLFLFIAHRIERVLPTIRSRAYLLRCRPVSSEVLKNALKEQGISVSDEVVQQAHGLPGLVISGQLEDMKFNPSYFTARIHEQLAVAAQLDGSDLIGVEIALSTMVHTTTDAKDYQPIIAACERYIAVQAAARTGSISNAFEHLFV